jgi:ribosomal protein L14E/L6E/L27E
MNSRGRSIRDGPDGRKKVPDQRTKVTLLHPADLEEPLKNNRTFEASERRWPAAGDCFQQQPGKQRHQRPRKHEGTKKLGLSSSWLRVFVAHQTLLVIPMQLKAVSRSH